jgi:H/ACA ribonucleoprotein complex subunit 3
MKHQIFFCESCDLYTLEKECPKCKKKTENPKPAKYSVEDKFGKYRRIAKKNG